MQWRGVRRLSVRPSVCPSVNFCANRFFSQTNDRIATKLAHDGLQVSMHPGVLKVKVKVKGHVIRALSWILGMSYSVIDGLVEFIRPFHHRMMPWKFHAMISRTVQELSCWQASRHTNRHCWKQYHPRYAGGNTMQRRVISSRQLCPLMSVI